MLIFGQGYVALSRATCLAGLTLRSFSPNAVKAHPKVIEFYRGIEHNRELRTFGGSAATASIKIEDGSPPLPPGMVRTTVLDLAADFNRPSSGAAVVELPVEISVVTQPQFQQQPASRGNFNATSSQWQWGAESAGSGSHLDSISEGIERQDEEVDSGGREEITLMSILDGISSRSKAGHGGVKQHQSLQKPQPAVVEVTQPDLPSFRRISPQPHVVALDKPMIVSTPPQSVVHVSPAYKPVAPQVPATQFASVVSTPSRTVSGPQEALYAAFSQLANHPSAVQSAPPRPMVPVVALYSDDARPIASGPVQGAGPVTSAVRVTPGSGSYTPTKPLHTTVPWDVVPPPLSINGQLAAPQSVGMTSRPGVPSAAQNHPAAT
eukprot:gene39510-48819_t